MFLNKKRYKRVLIFGFKFLKVQFLYTFVIIICLMLLLLSNSVNLRRDTSILYSRITIIILFFSILLLINDLYVDYLDKGIGLYGGLFHASSLTHIFHTFIFIISAIILKITAFYPRKIWSKDFSSLSKLLLYEFIFPTKKVLNKTGQQYTLIEYSLIILFIIVGAIFLISTSDLISIFLSIELQSYGLYLLSTLYRNSELATSAGLSYFLLGGLSSCFILLGASILYVNSGTTNFEGLYIIASVSDLINDSMVNTLSCYKPFYIHICLLIVSVGFLFKVSAAPFHFWSPEVYDAIPTIVTTFVAIIAKISIFIFLLELVYYTNKFFFIFNYTWTTSLLISSLFSLIIGTVVGLTQFRIKRLYAYSTISHLGFILLALSINSIESTQAFIFYIIQYSISNLNAFFLLITIGFSLYLYVKQDKNYQDMQDKNNSPIQLISQIKGYYYINPVLALSLSITLFSFVGIPPLVGFFGKQMVLSAALEKGYIFMALIAILTSVISAVYYLAIIKQIFFIKPEYKSLDLNNINFFAIIIRKNVIYKKVFLNNIVLSSSFTIIISILTLIILLFIFTPNELINMSSILSLILFNS